MTTCDDAGAQYGEIRSVEAPAVLVLAGKIVELTSELRCSREELVAALKVAALTLDEARNAQVCQYARTAVLFNLRPRP